MNKNNHKLKRGFAALAIVMLIGMLAVFFTMNTTVRGWSQEKNVVESKAAAQARFNAISCINLARLKLYTTTEPIGRYYVKNGYCNTESVSRSGDYFYVHTNAELKNAKIELQAELRATDFKINSIQEY